LSWIRSTTRLGTVLATLNKHAEAVQEYEQARELYHKLVKAHLDVPGYQHDLACTWYNLATSLLELGKVDESVKAFGLTRDAERKLVKAHPKRPEYSDWLIRTCLNRGTLLEKLNRHGEALADLTEGITWIDRLRTSDPKNPMIDSFLLFALPQRASVLIRLGRTRDADNDWGRALSVAPMNQRNVVRMQRAECRAGASDYRRSAVELEELSRLPGLVGSRLYRLACLQAVNAASAARDVSRPLPERDKRSEQSAQQAVALLRRAAKTGFFYSRENRQDLDTNRDLACLRDRDDYRAFRAALKSEKRDRQR
jgi:tetratricopeptide (TPR) repeat protein